MSAPDTSPQRDRMVTRQIEARGVTDRRVLEAMRTVPRERFVPDRLAEHAHDDAPLPIGEDQTISQPYIVALMIAALGAGPGDRALEVGAGSGYAAAVLSRIVSEVDAIEWHGALARAARDTIGKLGYDNVTVLHADGTEGRPERGPYDAILVSAAADSVPETLLDQLAVGGTMVVPLTTRSGGQQLERIRRTDAGLARESLGPVRFVPLMTEE